MRAIWNGVVLAETTDTVVVEGNHYFPRESLRGALRRERPADDVPVEGRGVLPCVQRRRRSEPDAAWYYPQPKDAAAQIRGRVAFWKGVEVVDG